MLNDEDKELVATLIQDEISKQRGILKEAIDLELKSSERLASEYLSRLTEVLSRVLFS